MNLSLPVALLVLLVACSFGPRLAGETTRRAWEFVSNGVEVTGAWLVIAELSSRLRDRIAAAGAQMVAYVGAILGAQALFRLGFPMDRRPELGGVSMGEALLGPWVWFLDAALVFWGAAYVAQGLSNGNGTNHR